MTSRLAHRLHRALPLAALLTLLGAATAPAAEFWLRAEAFTKVMPDGRAVAMWGYAPCTGGFASCAAPSAPGPSLTVPPGEGLTVHLQNNGLPEPVSITIPGQIGTSSGTVVRNADNRVRSFTSEVAPGATGDYVWTTFRPGTFLYQSGTHPAVQVQMGLYGAVLGSEPGGTLYGASFDQDAAILLSEVAPDLHDAVAAGQYGPGLAMTSTVEYKPTYFLVNGEPHTPGRSPFPLGAAGSTTLLRILNAGLLSHYLVFPWGDVVVAGRSGNALPSPVPSYEVDLHAGEAVDAFLPVPGPGYYPVHDRAGWLSTGGKPDGGLQFAFAVADAAMFPLAVAREGTGSGRVVAASLPGGIDCGTDCGETYNAGTEVRLAALADPGSAFAGWLAPAGCAGFGDCVVAMTAAQDARARFDAVARLTVIVPNGGEQIPEGSLFTIRWGAPAAARHFRVLFSSNRGRTWKLVRRGVVGSSYVWKVPLVARQKNRCRIRVLAYDMNGRRIGRDVSNRNFTILNTIP